MKKLSLPFTFLIITCFVFSVSCVSKEIPVTETYYETEYRTESYIETGDEQRVYIKPEWTRHAWVYLNVVEWGERGSQSFFDGYDISLAKDSISHVKLTLCSAPSLWAILVVDLTGLGPLTAPPARSEMDEKVVFEEGKKKVLTTSAEEKWLANLNAITADPKRILSLAKSDEYISRNITVVTTGVDQFMTWICTPYDTNPPIESAQLIWQSKLVKERQVPYEVQKQRTVTKIEKVPIWGVVFGE